MKQKQWMIHYAVILHLWWGILVLLDHSVINITAIHSMMPVFRVPEVLGLGLIAVGISGWIGTLEKMRYTLTGLVLLIPQQFVLMESMVGALIAIFNSTFADGVLRPRAFIAADQCPAIIGAIMHTFALFDLHLWPWFNKLKEKWKLEKS